MFWAVMFLLVGFFEEFLLRGYSQFTLTRVMGFWPAAVLLSCTFGLIHIRNGGEEWTGLLAAGGDRLFLLSDVAAHRELVVCGGISRGVGLGRDVFLFRAGQRDDFPGASAEVVVSRAGVAYRRVVGPEGSVLCFVVIGVVWAAFARVYPREVAELKEPLTQRTQGSQGSFLF